MSCASVEQKMLVKTLFSSLQPLNEIRITLGECNNHKPDLCETLWAHKPEEVICGQMDNFKQ